MTRCNTFFLAKWARAVFATPPEDSYFFGYYYQSPLSANGSHLLAHRAIFDGRNVKPSDQVEVGYFNLEDGSWHTLGVTHAFNWQQGAMLQWLGPDFQSRVSYNDREENQFVARMVDLSSGFRRLLPHAVYAVHPSGRNALGIRFERHYFCRAYHYEGVCDDRWNVPVHPEDGILDIDLHEGNAHLLLRTADIANFDHTSARLGVSHWLEHLIWNPSGTRFYFLHRFGNYDSYATRVFTADPDGTHLFCLPGHEEYSFTHAGWRGDSVFVNFALKSRLLAQAYSSLVGSKNPLKALIVRGIRSMKQIIPRDFLDRRREESGYALVSDRYKIERIISKGWLRRDGHPSCTRDGRYMLTDTYADETGYRHLLLYDFIRDQVHTVGRFFSPFNGGSYRCDLHPRFSRDERRIIIDTAHTGRHQMLVLEVAWDRMRR